MQLFSKEPVVHKVYLLFLFSGLSVLLSLGFHFYLEWNRDYYLTIEENERVKTHIALFVQQKIRVTQIAFQSLLLSESIPQLETTNKRIHGYIAQVRQAMDVIEHGGEYTEQIFSQTGGEAKVSQILRYAVPPGTHESPSAKAMCLGLEKLETLRQRFYGTMQQELLDRSLSRGFNLTLFDRISRPHFMRLVDNSNRLYMESVDALNHAQTRRDMQTKQMESALAVVVPGFILLTVWVAFRILCDIRRLVQERAGALDDLQQTNENLESLVARRTRALRQEVAERKLAEDRFSDQASFLINVIESLGYPFHVINAEDYSVSMANQAAKDSAMGDWTHCYAMRHGFSAPCGEQGMQCPLDEVRATREPTVFERKVMYPDGERVIEVHGYPIFGPDGAVEQLIEYSLDITDQYLARQALERSKDELEAIVQERTSRLEEEVEQRKKAQHGLEVSERHFRKLIEGIQDVIMILDDHGDITYVSPSVRSVLGYAPGDLTGGNILDIVLSDERAEVFLETLGRSGRMEHRVVAASGEHLVMEATARNMEDHPTIGGLLLTSRDITARKRAEEEQKRLFMAVEQNPSSVIITDIHGNIEYVNPQFERITGYSREEAVGKNPSVLSSGLTDPSVFQDMYATITRGEVWQGEFINKKRSGELYTENVIVAPIKDDLGEISNFVALKENVTELKKAREQAESASRAKSDFLSHMSHELRTPLNAIIGFSKLLMNDGRTPLAPKQAEQAGRIHAAGKHLMQMISEILDFSRIESGNIAIDLEALSPAGIIGECIMLSDLLASESRVTVVADPSIYSLPPLQIDRTRFKQVMINLVTNGIKYNLADGTVTVSARTEGDRGVIEVADTGIGIPEDQQDSVFEPFSRFAEKASTIEGTGIGMTITKQLVEAMDGTIDFVSKEGEGTVFTVVLPLADDSPKLRDRAENLLGTDGATAMLLYVDNEPERIAHMRERVAGWQGVTLMVRKSSAKGGEAISLLKPDLVLMHESVGDAGACALVEAGRSMDGSETAPVIVVLREHGDTCDPGPADGCVMQSMTLEELSSMYRTIMKGKA